MQCAKSFWLSSLLFIGTNLWASDIPVASLSAMRRSSASVEGAAASKDDLGSNVLLAIPGINQIVPLSINHLNRIVTPFENPEITTSSSVTTEVRQNVIYVGTDNEAPVTLFITEKGEEGAALSLTILPQRIPPREIILKLAKHIRGYMPTSGKKAQQWEQSQPYVATIRSLMRQLALGEIPQGYALSDEPGVTLVTCRQPGLHFDFSKGQQLVGHNLAVRIGLAKNTTKQPIEFSEHSCANWKVAAVAAWPKSVLLPGESSEVYVVQKIFKQQGGQAKRPSLLGRNR